MKKNLKFIIFLQTIALFIASCNIVNQNNKDEGLLIIDVKFIEKTFGIKMLPSEIEKINIEIFGEGLRNTIELNTSPQKPEVFLNIVHGRKYISAKAIYSNKIIVYGKNSVFVYPYVKNRVKVTLIKDSNYKPSPIPSELKQSASTRTDITSGATSEPSIIPQPSVNPTASAMETPTPSPSSTSTDYIQNSSIYYPNINSKLNIIISTPIPSGVTVGIFK